MNNLVRTSLCIVLLLFISACGTLEISVDRTPTPDVAATGTVGALQNQNANLETQIATISSPQANSTQAATAVTVTSPTSALIPSAMRIEFLNGATVGTVSAPIHSGQTQNYVLQAFQDQPMYVYIGSPNRDVTLAITRQDGAIILSAAARQISWQGSLLQGGDYYLTVYGGASSENFSLAVTIPSRIQFAAGTDSATLSGKTVAGYNVSYTISAAKGQNMSVDLGNLSGKASLSIYGFADGQQYLHSETGQTSYHFSLPSTQDYIIVVVPAASNVVSYSLTVKIQ